MRTEWLIGRLVGVVTVGAFLAAAPGALHAQRGESPPDPVQHDFDSSPENCVLTDRIRRTEVPDNTSILFHMRGGEVYLNLLPYACPGLAREQRFAYQVNNRRLCHVDTVTVLDGAGIGLRGGATCRLGRFYPLSADQVEELQHGPDMRSEIVAVPAPARSSGDTGAAGDDDGEGNADAARDTESAADGND